MSEISLNNYTYSDLLKKAIKQSGHTQEWLAKQLGVVVKTVNSWCNGRSSPDASEIRAIEKLLNKPIENLSNTDDNDPVYLRGRLDEAERMYTILVGRVGVVLEGCEKRFEGKIAIKKFSPRTEGQRVEG